MFRGYYGRRCPRCHPKHLDAAGLQDQNNLNLTLPCALHGRPLPEGQRHSNTIINGVVSLSKTWPGHPNDACQCLMPAGTEWIMAALTTLATPPSWNIRVHLSCWNLGCLTGANVQPQVERRCHMMQQEPQHPVCRASASSRAACCSTTSTHLHTMSTLTLPGRIVQSP